MRTWDRYLRTRGLLVVLSGPSGVGKDAVLTELEKICPGVRRCVTTTTRLPRSGEIDGVHYNFVSVGSFRRQADENEFLEFAQVHGNLYGTPRRWVEDNIAQGHDVILKIDVQGGLAVKQQAPSAVMTFVVPPSMDELERRLRSRLTESEAEVTKRLLDARNELEQIPNYTYIIENDSLPSAAEQLKAVIVAEHCRVK